MPSNYDTALGNLTKAGFNRNTASSFLNQNQDFTNLAATDFSKIQNILNQGITGGLEQVNSMLFPQEGSTTPTVSTVPTQSTTNPFSGLTRVSGPKEFEQARKTLGVDENNFDQFFKRDKAGNIYYAQDTKIPNTIDTGNLTETGDFRAVADQGTGLEELYSQATSGAKLSLDSTQKLFDALQTETGKQAETTQAGLTKKIEDLMNQLSGRTAREKELTTEAKIPEQISTLSDLNQQLAQMTGDFENLITAEGGRNIPKAFTTGRQQYLRRQAAVELGSLAGVVQAVQGNIGTAHNIIEKTIQREYQPIIDQIDLVQTQLELNAGVMSREEKKRAEILQFTLDERKRALENEKELKLNISNIAIEAGRNGAPVEVLRAINGSSSYSQAINAAAGYLQEPKLASISEQLKAAEDGYVIVNGDIVSTDGTVDPITGAPTIASKVITTDSGAYNFTSYATDPDWGVKIQTIMANMPEFTSNADVDAYIQQVAPGSIMTGNDIQTVSLESGIAPEMLMAILQLESRFGTSNVAIKNNNPGGFTWNANFSKNMKGTARPSTEGGNYVKFDTMQDGIRAIANNINRRRFFPGEDGVQTTTFPTDKELETMDNEAREFVNRVMRLLPTKLKDSEQERKDRMKEALFDFRQGKPFQQTVDEIKGFVIENRENLPMANVFRTLASNTDIELSDLAAAINRGDMVRAMTDVEKANLKDVDNDFGDLKLAQTTVQKASEANNILNELGEGYVGLWDNAEQKIRIKIPQNANNEDRQKAARLAALLTDINKGIRLKYLGSAMTATESSLLEPFLTSTSDQGPIIKTKLDNLINSVLREHNAARNISNLPEVDTEMLLDNNFRLQLYNTMTGNTNNEDPLGLF